MGWFRKILVGVDLTRSDEFSTSKLNPSAQEAIEWAIDLAEANSASLLFFAALNLTEDRLRFLQSEQQQRVHAGVARAADAFLGELANLARKRGVDAQSKCAAGKGWLEIVRQVNKEQHDLVVVGTRDRTGLRRLLFGNTAMKLLRSCPCPVLVAKEGSDERPLNILVASDLEPSSLEALRQGIAFGNSVHSNVHVLHVLDFPLDRIWCEAVPDMATLKYHGRVRSDAKSRLEEQLDLTGAHSLGDRLHVHLVDGIGFVDSTILNFIQAHSVHLLIMGTIGRSGISAFMFGNTAERLLPEVQCSVLAVKPPGFQCPVDI